MKKLNSTVRTHEDQDTVNVDLTASGLAYK